MHAKFVHDWKIIAPLHSSEIRSRNKNFLWLRNLDKHENEKFHSDLFKLMRDVPAIGIACVVDRPGYNSRFLEKFNNEPWLLCKSAFAIVVERAAKFAIKDDRKLRVNVERCNKAEDRRIKEYYYNLRDVGQPFNEENSKKYNALSPHDFHSALYDLRLKEKSSPVMQLADLCLWPMCIGGYHQSNRPYSVLRDAHKFIDTHLPEKDVSTLGMKYYCFENVIRKT